MTNPDFHVSISLLVANVFRIQLETRDNESETTGPKKSTRRAMTSARWQCPLSEALEECVCGGFLELGIVPATLRSIIVATAEEFLVSLGGSNSQQQQPHPATNLQQDLRRRLRARDAAVSANASSHNNNNYDSMTRFSVLIDAQDLRHKSSSLCSHCRKSDELFWLSFSEVNSGFFSSSSGATSSSSVVAESLIFPRVAPSRLVRIFSADGGTSETKQQDASSLRDGALESTHRKENADALAAFTGVLNEMKRRQMLDAVLPHPEQRLKRPICATAIGYDFVVVPAHSKSSSSASTDSAPAVVKVERDAKSTVTAFRFFPPAGRIDEQIGGGGGGCEEWQLESRSFEALHTQAVLERFLKRTSWGSILPHEVK